jgi:hypothetical protein
MNSKNLKMTLGVILFSIVSSYAQTIYLPDYFPLRDNGKWIYKNAFSNYDTATMKVDTTSPGETDISLSFNANEKQYFKADVDGLRMLGQTIPLGTFMFNTPLGISSVDAKIGDGAWTYNWDVTHVPSGIQMSWGTAQALLDRIETNLTILDSTYDSVLVISVLFGHGEGQYYLAKGIGIVKASANGSPFFTSRELVKFVPPPTTVASNNWKTYAKKREVKVISDLYGEMVKISMPMYGNILEVTIYGIDGRIIDKNKYVNNNNSELRIQEKLKPGCYILQLRDGASFQSRSFSVLR